MRYKFSEYNVLVEDEDSILFNTRTLALGILDSKKVKLFKNKNVDELNELDKDDLDCLLENGFIIPESIFEKDILKKEYWEQKVNSDMLNISIMTTLDCNFKCSYCFEQRQNIKLNTDVESRILKFIEKKIDNYKVLHIDWYGGEPLLNIDSIVRMSNQLIQLCKSRNIKYTAGITTNGYNLDQLNKDLLKDICIKFAQITIDGPKKIHDKRRMLKNGNGTFNKIISNIKELMNEIDICIRINVDKTNILYVELLLEYLRDNNVDNLTITIKGILSSESNPCEELEISAKEISGRIVDLYEYAMKLGFKTLLFLPLMKINRQFCIVDSNAQYIISPDGKVFKCGESYKDNDPSKIGELASDGELIQDIYARVYWNKDPFEFEECSDCKILPFCMGGCLLKRKVKKISPCIPEYKYNFERILKMYYKFIREKL